MKHIPGELATCSKCGDMKPWTREFFVWSNSRGVAQPCRECSNAYTAVYDATHKMDKAAYNAAYGIAHKSEHAAHQAKYDAAHKPEKAAHTAKHRARKRDLPDNYTFSDFRRAKVVFNYRCAYCGKTPKAACNTDWTLHQDHYIPLNDTEHCPGTVSTNIVPACQYCNYSKHDSDPHTWAVAKFGVRKAKKIEARIQAFFEAERVREQTR